MTEALELDPSLGDGDLARASAEGDRQAFAEIYDRYADRLYDFCVGLIGDRDAAADCVQDTFCVAAKDLGVCANPTNSARGCTRSPAIMRCAVFGTATARRSLMNCLTWSLTKQARKRLPDKAN